jgi:hypothetical protein
MAISFPQPHPYIPNVVSQNKGNSDKKTLVCGDSERMGMRVEKREARKWYLLVYKVQTVSLIEKRCS